MRVSSSGTRPRSATGSKVITDPVELGPDLLELLLRCQCGRRLGHPGMLAARVDAAGGLPPAGRAPRLLVESKRFVPGAEERVSREVLLDAPQPARDLEP